MKRILSILNKPFPIDNRDERYYFRIFLISLFIGLFLYVFKPFGLHRIPHLALKYSLLMFATCFVSSVVYDYFLRLILGRFVGDEKYTLLIWILEVTGLVTVIGIVNYFISNWFLQAGSTDLLSMIFSTWLIGLFPLFFIGMLNVKKSELANVQLAQQYNRTHIEHEKEDKARHNLIHEVEESNIIAVESIQNYVKLTYLEGHNVHNKTIRATQKSILDQLNDPDIIKCHRSYLVNKSMIESISGNSQGLKLKMLHGAVIIPVSRSYLHHFKN